MTPTASVIIPAFNASRSIEATLQSVLDQTFRDLEVVVIDDGSSDATSEVVARVSQQIRCIRTTNCGVAAARNRGIQESSGRYLAFLDADDLWLPTKLERQVELLERDSSAGGCYVGVIFVDAELEETGRSDAVPFPDLCRSLLLYSSVIPSSASSLVVRRSADQRAGGFNIEFSQCADWDYLLRLSRTTTLRPVDDHLILRKSGDWNMSNDINLLERDTFAVLDRFFRDAQNRPYGGLRQRSYSNHCMIVSGCYLHTGNPAAALRCLIQGLRLWPRNITRPIGLPLRWAHRLASQKVQPRLPNVRP